ncbi:MAG: hypothetical protein A2233_04835 [Candidatus Kerfeldbacteria bacterium RIFOXYA2_FULL_38_24]|uniref:5'-deoxynucleotidase n=1 Tax=Candidatus Kerfeldbacteria bacterium RIFOXYB2_FULL_38_14 TaxID=1798547 RepID=A0A1G2BFR1_9BACT|nr:MAG: hypothetical protein A2319_02245 [Candidatus Kerfeldbacteria bacterium RIFOXYB2_FULL_38_14]OGY88196.1 MAG: hypothetical protein A2233_04835 [Candidatus Kerfeldbacteria bacterium RIFOXYA2_FULL_38_24]OGY89216.1 MAG: hypothetical protein A2458_01310 [Candidatus Kerfeldbacteria bacterium RIFOXYC2_FULL_38_9]
MVSENSLSPLYQFIQEVQKLKYIDRAVLATESRKESSAEHCWSVGVIVWFLSDAWKKEFNTDIDVNKIIKMALMHDIIEVRVGDVSVWDKKKRLQIEQKERDGFMSIISTLPTSLQTELASLWNELQEGQTLESKMVSGADRLSAAIQRLITKQGWVTEGHNEKDLDGIQLPKINFSKVLLSFYNEIKQESFNNGLLEKSSSDEISDNSK